MWGHRQKGGIGGGVTVLCGFDARAECGEMRRLCGRRERTADAGWWWEGGEGGDVTSASQTLQHLHAPPAALGSAGFA